MKKCYYIYAEKIKNYFTLFLFSEKYTFWKLMQIVNVLGENSDFSCRQSHPQN